FVRPLEWRRRSRADRQRYRRRYRPGGTRTDLREVSAGRQSADAPARRHRLGVVYRPRVVETAGRRGGLAKRTGPRQHVHGASAVILERGAAPGIRSGARGYRSVQGPARGRAFVRRRSRSAHVYPFFLSCWPAAPVRDVPLLALRAGKKGLPARSASKGFPLPALRVGNDSPIIRKVHGSAGRSLFGKSSRRLGVLDEGPCRGKSGLHRTRWWVTPTVRSFSLLRERSKRRAGKVQQKDTASK